MKVSDVVVVGGGLIGCATARALALEGLRVEVLERARPGGEASAAAAGMLAAQVESQAGGPMVRLRLAARARWDAFAAEVAEASGRTFGYRRDGIFVPATDAAGLDAMADRHAWQVSEGLAVERVEGAGLRALEPNLSDAVPGGLLFPQDGHLCAPALASAMSLAAESAGVRIRPGVTVQRLASEGARVRGAVLHDGEVVGAGAVVLAAGAWSSLTEGCGLAGGAIRPARGQMLALDTPARPVRRPAFADGLGYVVPWSDGRTVVGSTMEMAGYDKRVTAGGIAHLARVAVELFPCLADAPISGSWAGFRPWTADELPLLGPGFLDGLHFATGHYRAGVLLAPLTAEVVRDGVLGRPPAVDLHPCRPERFAGREAPSLAEAAEP